MIGIPSIAAGALPRSDFNAMLHSCGPEPSVVVDLHDEISRHKNKVLVLDDDATGTQTVHGVPVALDWASDTLTELMRRSGRISYVLTNSRSLDSATAAGLTRQIVTTASVAARRLGLDVTLISRSDSTLRGHYPAETTAAMEAASRALGCIFYAEVLIPALIEAGRITANRTHWVEHDDIFVPVGQTEYARDPSFGYSASDLAKWVSEKTNGKIGSDSVAWIPLASIRGGGPKAVQALIAAVPEGSTIVCDAASYGDLGVLALAFLRLERGGLRFLYRTAASWVAAYGGIGPGHTVRPADLLPPSRAKDGGGGLIVVGSHVDRSTRQLLRLLREPRVVGVELVCSRSRSKASHRQVRRCVESIERALRAGLDAVLYTAGAVGRDDGVLGSPDAGREIMQGLVDVVTNLTVQPRYLVAKGGITSSKLAAEALGCRIAEVVGQLQPGVAAWRLDESAHLATAPYIVYPGNVGGDCGLVDVVRVFRGSSPC